MQGTAGGHIEVAAARAVHVVDEIDDALGVRLCGLDENCARAVTKQDTGGAILEIEDRGHYVAPDHENFFGRAGSHELRAYGQRIDETRARRREIEPPGFRSAEAILDQT